MVLFNAKGYPETSMAEIASAVGIPYRGSTATSPASATILATGLRAARPIGFGGRLSAILTGLTEPGHMLTMLIEALRGDLVRESGAGRDLLHRRVNLTRVDRGNCSSNVQTLDDRCLGCAYWQRRVPALTKYAGACSGPCGDGAGSRCGSAGALRELRRHSAYSQACVRKLMEATVFGTGG